MNLEERTNGHHDQDHAVVLPNISEDTRAIGCAWRRIASQSMWSGPSCSRTAYVAQHSKEKDPTKCSLHNFCSCVTALQLALRSHRVQRSPGLATLSYKVTDPGWSRTSHRRDCHFADVPSPPLLKHRLNGE